MSTPVDEPPVLSGFKFGLQIKNGDKRETAVDGVVIVISSLNSDVGSRMVP